MIHSFLKISHIFFIFFNFLPWQADWSDNCDTNLCETAYNQFYLLYSYCLHQPRLHTNSISQRKVNIKHAKLNDCLTFFSNSSTVLYFIIITLYLFTFLKFVACLTLKFLQAFTIFAFNLKVCTYITVHIMR